MQTTAQNRLTNEWLLGATAGGYLILTFVLCFWGSTLLSSYCANISYALTLENGVTLDYLAFLIPGMFVAVLGWMQLRLLQSDDKLVSARAVRVGLWMNFLGVASLLLGVSEKVGPDGDGGYLWLAWLLGIVLIAAGILVSLGNIAAGHLQRFRNRQKLSSPTETE
jgi:hypothetical protein